MSRVHCAALNVRTPPSQRVGGAQSSQRYGGHGERETPGLIPNPEAKPFSADGTARGTGWESRTPPDILSRNGVTATAVAPFLHFAVPPVSAPKPDPPPAPEAPMSAACPLRWGKGR